MRGLEAPPKTDTPSKLVARLLTLVILAAAAGIAVYTAVTNQRADLTEDIRPVNLNLEDTTVIDGLRTNVRQDPGGETPVVILHDFDVTGGLILEGLSTNLGSDFHGVRIDLPGFGYSSRMPADGTHHTVAGMADLLAPVLEERFDEPVLIVGVGLGGQIGAELALTYAHLVDGLVMVDTDFWADTGFPQSLQSIRWLGKAATFTWETGGRFALAGWSPHCDAGGWCPTREQVSIRSVIVELERTTDSLHAFRRTHTAALAPSNFDQISVPMAYVWSTEGQVPQSTIDQLADEIPGLSVMESATFQAHLEDAPTIATALAEVAAAGG